MTRRRGLVVVLAALLALAAAAIVWWRGSGPRQAVGRVLATRLDADVSLGAVEVVGSGTLVLRDLEIARPAAAPWVRRLRLDEVTVQGGLRELTDGRVDSIVVRGGEAHLEPITPGEPGDGEGMRVGRLEIAGLDVFLHAAGGVARARADGELTGSLGDPAGELRLASDALHLEPLLAYLLGEERVEPILARARLALAEPYPDFRATVTLAPSEPVRVTASGGGRLAVGERVRLPFPDTTVTLHRAAGGFSPERLDVELTFPGVADARVEMAREDDALALAAARLDTARPEVVLRALDLLPAGWAIAGDARLALAREAGTRYRYDAAGRFARLVLPAGEGAWTAGDVAWDAFGTVRLDGLDEATPITADVAVASLAATSLDVPAGLAPLDVAFAGTFDPGDGVDVAGRAVVETATVGTIETDGLLALGGTEARADLAWRWRGAPAAAVASFLAELGAAPPVVAAGGRLHGHGRLTGPLASPAVAGFLLGDDLRLATADPDGTMTLHDVRLRTDFRYDAGVLRLGDATVSGVVAGGAVEEAQRFAVRGPVRFDVERGLLTLGPLVLDAPEVGRVTIAGTWTPDDGFDLAAELPALDETLVTRYVEPALRDLLPAGWTFAYDPAVRLRLALAGERWRADGTVTLAGVEATSPDGARVVQAPDTTWAVAGEGLLDALPAATFTAATRLGGFAVLWGSVFADYGDFAADLAVALEASEASSGEDGIAWSGDLTLVPDDDLRVTAAFSLPPGGPLAYEARLEAERLDEAFARHVRAPLAESVEALAGMEVGGRAGLAVAGVAGPEATTARGVLAVDGLDLYAAGGEVTVRGLDLVLPLDLAWRGSEPVAGAPRRGSLAFAGLHLGPVDVGAVATELVARGDDVGLERPLDLALLGGHVELAHLTLVDALAPGRHLAAALDVVGLDLGELAGRFGLELEGEVGGSFPDVRLSGDTFTVEGGGELAVFGGTVTVSDISGEEIFSDLPKVELSADFQGVDLAALTQTVDFGEVSGVARGHVHHLVLFGGTPVRFDGEIESVETPGVPQTITLKAIESISILGTGATPAAGVGSVLLRLFDRYRYAKLGAHLTLQGDVFLMRGLARRGDKELFMKGRFPPVRIDVVNASPGHTVSFSTMLERLRYADIEVGEAPASRKE